MKLVDLLSEVLTESSQMEDVLRDCAFFLSKNKNVLKEGPNYLWRSTPRMVVGYVKVKPRRREDIKGNPYLYYFFEKKKPANVPSRRDMIPCQGYMPSSAFMKMQRYSVLPIGSNYKLVYAKGIQDFNYNPLFGDRGAPFLEQHMKNDWVAIDDWAHRDPKYYPHEQPPHHELKETWADYVKELTKMAATLTGKADLERLEKEADIIVNSLRKIRDRVENILPETYEALDQFDLLMDAYIRKLRVSKILEPEMRNVEVSVYAPEGFYYVRSEDMRKIKDHLGW